MNATLTSDKDKDIRVPTERILEDNEGFTECYRLSELLIKMVQLEKIQQIYDVLLEQTTTESAEGNINT